MRIKSRYSFLPSKWRYPIYAIFSLLLSFPFGSIQAQPYIEGGNTRHRFAQLNLGFDTRFFTEETTISRVIEVPGIDNRYKFKSETEARIIIGGTHFWGHADFYIAIPVFSKLYNAFSTRVETGARYFPWRIENHKLRPYIGFSLTPIQLQISGGAEIKRMKTPIQFGAVFCLGKHLLEIGGAYTNNNTEAYYQGTTDLSEIRFSSLAFFVGYKFMLETTLSAESDWKTGRTKSITDTLGNAGKLDGFTIAFGPSAAFYLQDSEHNSETAPYLDQHKSAKTFLEFDLGYYLHRPDIQFNLAYRKLHSDLSAFDHNQYAQRQSLTLEVYKFLFDFHGFAFFTGPAISYEHLQISEHTPTNIALHGSYKGLKPGLTFGWDIRPNRLQNFLLRTNLRYFPNMNVSMPVDRKFSFDQLEFNFIQVVIYPQRFF